MRRHWQSTAPGAEALDLDAVKLHLRVDHAADDDLIADLIAVATEQAESYTGRALIRQSWTVTDTAATWPLALLRWPVLDITSLTADGVQHVTDGVLDSAFTLYPGDDAQLSGSGTAVTVVYRAGYGTDYTAVPAPIRQWMMLKIGALYEHRESVIVGANAGHALGFVDGLLAPYRSHLLGWPA